MSSAMPSVSPSSSEPESHGSPESSSSGSPAANTDSDPSPHAAASPSTAAASVDVPSDLLRLLDIPLTIHVELGRKRMRIRELMDIGTGAVVDLGTAAGSPLAIYANHTLIAQGEAVVVGDRYGVRVTDIVSPEERVRRLGSAEGE